MSKAQGEGQAFLNRSGRFTLHIHRNGRVDFVPGTQTAEEIEEARQKYEMELIEAAAAPPKKIEPLPVYSDLQQLNSLDHELKLLYAAARLSPSGGSLRRAKILSLEKQRQELIAAMPSETFRLPRAARMSVRGYRKELARRRRAGVQPWIDGK